MKIFLPLQMFQPLRLLWLFWPLDHLSSWTITFCSIIYMTHLLLICIYKKRKTIFSPLTFYLVFSPSLSVSVLIFIVWVTKYLTDIGISVGSSIVPTDELDDVLSRGRLDTSHLFAHPSIAANILKRVRSVTQPFY